MNRKINYLPVSDMVVESPKKPLKQGSLKEPTMPFSKTFSSSASYERHDISPNLNYDINPKVICHSPQVIHSNIHTNKCGQPEKISMDVPPTLVVTSEISLDKSSNSGSGMCPSNLQLCQDTSDAWMNNMSISQPVYDDGCLDTSKPINLVSEKAVSKAQVTSSQLTKEVGIKHVNSSISELTKRKKKLPKFVASRYLTSNRQNSKQTSPWETSHSKQSDTSMRLNKSALNQPKPTKSLGIPKPYFSGTTCTARAKEKNNFQTEEKTSTPTAGFKKIFESDVSTIQQHTLTKTKHLKAEIKPKNISQADLNIAYSNYISQAYVKCTMEKAAKIRHNEALSDITKLTNANMKLQEEVADLEDEVKFLEHEQYIDKQLDAQICMLSPVVNKLAEVQRKYGEMVENIDTTRHQLAIEDTTVPSETHLDLSLKQTHNVLCDITTLTHTHADSCENAAHHSMQVQKCVGSEERSVTVAEKDAVKLEELSWKEAHLIRQLETEKMF